MDEEEHSVCQAVAPDPNLETRPCCSSAHRRSPSSLSTSSSTGELLSNLLCGYPRRARRPQEDPVSIEEVIRLDGRGGGLAASSSMTSPLNCGNARRQRTKVYTSVRHPPPEPDPRPPQPQSGWSWAGSPTRLPHAGVRLLVNCAICGALTREPGPREVCRWEGRRALCRRARWID